VSEFRPHDVVWTDDKVKRIWDFTASVPAYEASYFSHVVGDLVLNYVTRSVQLRGRVLDFGCGPGYMMEKLVKRGVAVEGIDFSEHSVKAATDRLSGHQLFRGARHITALPLPESDGTYDVVFLIETIEHIITEHLESTLTELARLVRRGGTLVVTTPNREDLRANTVMCPECGCTFHRIQHVHSWSADSLAQTMQRHGFRPVRTYETTFRRGDVLNTLYKIGFSLIGRRQPNLLYIGERA